MSLHCCRNLAKGMLVSGNRFAASRGRYASFGVLQRNLSTPSADDAKNASPEKPAIADGPNDYGYTPGHDPRFIDNKPTLDYAIAMPRTFSAMRHEQILQLAAEGVPEARAEALVRNIMSVDRIEYDEAEKIMQDIGRANRQNMSLHHLPHGIGLVTAVTAGAVSLPLVFYFPVVNKFNELYVTTDIPEPQDLETWLEVGSWSWAWMEPVLGQISFVLLTAAFARAQMKNMGFQPYTNFMRERRAAQLVALYPQYDKKILSNFSRTDMLVQKPL
uniref:Uncharacterized protein n=1 Tax=Helicotheca tamesis TaxID=374047 RepID=A0A7S2MFE8_9STRA|mmetsp:Transcript_15156/g.20665  ORF Transcript_15156/g.20665 Transcript_15156/m.20665 type:complete len:274 (+) Transcript_15156:68-889(+)